MLAVPLKSCNKVADWKFALNDYIAKNFGQDQVADHARDVTKLHTTRSRVCAAHAADQDSIQAIRSYMALLKVVGTKFPTLRGGDGKLEWRSLQFQWSDAFRPKKTLIQTDVEYERACVYFNWGALESLAGMQQDRTTPEGVKAATMHFQIAAGVFSVLHDSLIPAGGDAHREFQLHGPFTSDLTPEATNMLKNLMLAQAQVCYLDKATRDNMKPSSLSKLAMEASKFYDAAFTSSKTETLSAVLDKSWTFYFEFHKKEYEAVAEYHTAQATLQKANETGEGYGESIARLKRALAAAKVASDSATKNKLPAGVLNQIQKIAKQAVAEEAKAIDDNNKIYMNPVPDVSALPLPSGAALAKLTPPDLSSNVTSNGGGGGNAGGGLQRQASFVGAEELFKGLVPTWMRTAEALFQSKLAQLVKDMGDKVETRNSEIRQQLSEAGLPASVESAGGAGGNNVPDHLWDRIVSHVHSVGGVQELMNDSVLNNTCAERMDASLQKIAAMLEEEEGKDADARVQGFTGQPSAQLNGTMRADLTRYRNLFETARKSDKGVQDKFNAARTGLEMLAMSREELAAWLPPDGASEADKDPKVEKERQDLSMLLVSLGVKVNESEVAQTSMVEKQMSDSIISKLTKQDAVQSVIADALAQYKPLINDVEAKLSSINVMFAQILERNHAFAALRHQNEFSRRRENALKQVDDAIIKFNELVRVVAEGSKFYADMEIRVEQLRVVVSDHCYVRGLERDEFVQRQTQRSPAQSMSADYGAVPVAWSYDGGGANAPPPYSSQQPPPPPQYQGNNSNTMVVQGSFVVPPPDLNGGLTGAHATALGKMRDILGLDAHGPISAAMLIPYLERAKWDVGVAVNEYFERPPAAPASAPPPPSTAPTRAAPSLSSASGSTKTGGWFR